HHVSPRVGRRAPPSRAKLPEATLERAAGAEPLALVGPAGAAHPALVERHRPVSPVPDEERSEADDDDRERNPPEHGFSLRWRPPVWGQAATESNGSPDVVRTAPAPCGSGRRKLAAPCRGAEPTR